MGIGMTWTLADLDRVIGQAKANRRSGAYVAALERQRARLLAREEKALAPVTAASDASGERTVEVVNSFLEAGMALLEVAPGVGEGDAVELSEMMSILASWFPPESAEVEGEDDAM